MEKQPPAKFYRGELFDLTVTSANNKYGKAKIDHSLNNGINFKMEYFIEELNKITSGIEDDKSKKRKIRKEFLELCNSNEILKELFNLLINYLNGGQTLNMKNEYNNQSLIVVLMGGNIINIYFNIIYIIKFNSNIENTIVYISNIFNDNITNFTERFSEVLHSLKNFYSINSDFKKNMERFKDTNIFNSYSDLDFALLPNNLDTMQSGGVGSGKKRARSAPVRFSFSPPDKSDLKKKPEKKQSSKKKPEKKQSSKKKPAKKPSKKPAKKNIEDLKSANGFLLYRIKSNFSILDEYVNSKQEIKFFEDVKKKNDTINRTHTSSPNDCIIDDIQKLGILFRSELIAHLAQKHWLTIQGITTKCKSFIENLLAKKERTILCTNKNTEIICDDGNKTIPDVDKLKNLISYIRKITTTINLHLTTIEQIKNPINIFDSLYTIMNSNLINICNSIIAEFYKLEETQHVIYNINEFYKNANAKSNNFSISNFNIDSYINIQYIIDQLLEKLSQLDLKSGIILTINLIKGNHNDKVIYPEYEYENENKYFDDLEKEFIYDQNRETTRMAFAETDRLLAATAKGKNKKIRITARKCRNKKYRKKHTKKCKKILQKLREAKK